MSPTQSSIDHQIPDVRPPAVGRRRFRDLWMLGTLVLIIFVALYHLATFSNSEQPTPMGIQPHRTIHLVRAEHQAPASTKESRSEASPALEDESVFDPSAFPEPLPYGAGWR